MDAETKDMIAHRNAKEDRTAIIKRGDEGQKVRTLQRALIDLGYKVGTMGSFGQEVTDAVKAFQKARGMSETGIVNAPLLAELMPGRTL